MGSTTPRRQLTGKACNGFLTKRSVLNGILVKRKRFKRKGEKRRDMVGEKSKKRSINFPIEMLEVLDTLAAKKHTTTSELVRQFVEKGLSMEGYTEQVDLIARIIRQELMAIYHIEDIKAIVEQQTNRIAKMLMKSGKIDSASFFLLIKVLMNMANEGTEEEFDQMLNESIHLGVDYMQKKDFQINDFLYDTDELRKRAKNL